MILKGYEGVFSKPAKCSRNSVWGVKLVRRDNTFLEHPELAFKNKKYDNLKEFSKKYRGTGYYCPELVGRITIFNSSYDLEKFYPFILEDDTPYLIYRVALKGDIISIDMRNKHHHCRIFAGNEVVMAACLL